MTEPAAWAAGLQAERQARDWRTWHLARRLYAAAGIEARDQTKVKNLARQINRHENGQIFPAEWASAYAIVDDTPESELFRPEIASTPLRRQMRGTASYSLRETRHGSILRSLTV